MNEFFYHDSRIKRAEKGTPSIPGTGKKQIFVETQVIDGRLPNRAKKLQRREMRKQMEQQKQMMDKTVDSELKKLKQLEEAVNKLQSGSPKMADIGH